MEIDRDMIIVNKDPLLNRIYKTVQSNILYEGGKGGVPITHHAEFFHYITHHGEFFFTNHASRKKK